MGMNVEPHVAGALLVVRKHRKSAMKPGGLNRTIGVESTNFLTDKLF